MLCNHASLERKYKDRHNLILGLPCASAYVLARAKLVFTQKYVLCCLHLFCPCACEATES